MARRVLKAFGIVFGLLAVLACAALAFVYVQGRRTPDGVPSYVALGSSYAAGAGLGPLAGGSPLLCARGSGGYPQQLARSLQLPLVDMACGGAVTRHLLSGGQFFQGAQIRVIDARTRLVTITVGGNDIGYVGDLSMLAMRRAGGVGGWLVRRLWSGPTPEPQRGYAALAQNLDALIAAIRTRAPRARIVLASYPTVLPPTGTCARLGLSAEEADRMRPVAARLAAVTRAAARKGGALLVDMDALGRLHSACAADPWTNGWTALSKAPFHPDPAGAQATASAIAAALGSPAGIAAVGQHDAAGHQAGGVGR